MNAPESATGTPLKRSSVVAVVLLTFVTGGIYTSIWYLRRRQGLNALESASKIGVAEPLVLLAVTILFLVLPGGSTPETIAQLAVGIINIALAFKVRWMMVDHLAARITAVLPRSGGIQSQYSPSSLLTFLFNIWYLQYKINEFIEASQAWALADTAGDGATT